LVYGSLGWSVITEFNLSLVEEDFFYIVGAFGLFVFLLAFGEFLLA
jgi:hypothetical protein